MKVLYTGSFRFPDKDAASQRVLNIGKVFRKVGYDVVFFGWELKERQEDYVDNRGYFFERFRYLSQNELDRGFRNPFLRLGNFIFRGSKTLSNIKKYIKNEKIDYIIVYNANSYFLYKLHQFSKKNNIKLICDCTEWYEPDHLPGGKYGLANFDNNLRINKLYPLIKNVIVISSFLEKHLDKLGCRTIIIPPLVDLELNKWKIDSCMEKTNNERIRLIYAGNPGKKDLLSPFFEALKEINKNSIRIEFMILGSGEEYVRDNFYSNDIEIPCYIKCMGFVMMSEVSHYYNSSHFSVLLREDKRYAHAGFPTKLVESLSSGVPLVTNNTSDIKKYIKDGMNGFILRNNSTEGIIECFNTILKLPKKDLQKLSENSKKVARNNFDFNTYADRIVDYLTEIN